MKLRNYLTGISLIASTAIAFSASPVRAFNFTHGTNLGTCDVLVDNLTTPLFKAYIDDTTDVNTCQTADGFTLTGGLVGGGPGTSEDTFLQGKMVDKDEIVKGIGVSIPTPGPVPGEIQHGEELKVELDVAKIIKSIDLSFLYVKGEFADKVFEVAEITAFDTDGNETKGTLSVVDETTAVWSLGGTVINLDPSREVEGGAYSIKNPFGNISVASLLFTAPDPEHRAPFDSDYSLVAIETDVPEPATILGLSIVGGLMASTRRRRQSR
ncbi:MAG: PEP-CTERM sorting domain-containing protein [Cyanobacteriota bacterium]|nr:PEP-CTERM sorting domain-containing protein [Cyanobacteriota bacterium]